MKGGQQWPTKYIKAAGGRGRIDDDGYRQGCIRKKPLPTLESSEEGKQFIDNAGYNQ